MSVTRRYISGRRGNAPAPDRVPGGEEGDEGWEGGTTRTVIKMDKDQHPDAYQVDLPCPHRAAMLDALS